MFDGVFANKPKIPIYVTLCKFPLLSAHYYKIDKETARTRVEKLMDIGLTFPFVNGIIKKIDKKFYLDGGLVDNNPIYPLLHEDLDLILLLHCDAHYIPHKAAVYSKKIIIDVDVTLHNKGRNNTFSLKNNELIDMLEGGYEYGVSFYDDIFRNCVSKNELIERVHCFIRSESLSRKRKTSFLTIVNYINYLHWGKNYK